MSRVKIRDGGLMLRQAKGTGIPPAPDKAALKLFTRTRAGRMLLHHIGPSGIDTGLQPAFFGNSVYVFTANTGAGVGILPLSIGTPLTARVTGTGATNEHIATATTNDGTTLDGIQFDTGTTTTGVAGFQTTKHFIWRGNAANRGGWFFMCRFSPITIPVNTYQLIIGLATLNGLLAGEPSVLTNSAGLMKDSGDTTFQFSTRDASTTSKTNTAITPTAGSVYDFLMFAPPNGSDITMRLANGMTGALLAGDTVKASNLPTNTSFLSPMFQLRSTTGTTSKEFRMAKMYIETDI